MITGFYQHIHATDLWVYTVRRCDGVSGTIVSQLTPETLLSAKALAKLAKDGRGHDDEVAWDTEDHVAVWAGQQLTDGTTKRTIGVTMIRGVFSEGVFVPRGTPVFKADDRFFVKFPSIEHLNNVVRKLERDRVVQEIMYRGKIKLHGTNAAVCKTGHVIRAQKRSDFCTPDRDNAGFAAWVAKHEAAWQRLAVDRAVVFGEWVGPGVQKGDAVCQIPHKAFCIFGIALPAADSYLTAQMRFVYEPDDIREMVAPVLATLGDAVKVIDWHTPELPLVPAKAAPLEQQLNAAVARIADLDPWVRQTWGVEGPGEGLVLYPTHIVAHEATSYAREATVCTLAMAGRLMFKCKTPQHAVKKTARPVQAATQPARTVADFVDMFVTPARCAQMAADGATLDEFVQRLQADIAKEGGDERAPGWAEAEVNAAIAHAARQWWRTATR